MSENVNKICNAVRNENNSCKLLEAIMLLGEAPLARERVCRRDDSAFGVTGVVLIGYMAGEGGRAGRNGGEGGIPFREGVFDVCGTFFLPPNDRRNDHSDSN